MSSTRTAQHRVSQRSPRGVRSSRGSRTWALDVADDGTGLVVHKLYADLGDTTARTFIPTQISRPPSGENRGRILAYRCGRERG